MTEIILLIAKTLGVLFIVCKIIHKFSHVSDSHDVIDLMGNSLAIRAGIFSSKRKG